ncbi:type II toxin-antitoxin system VapC family toxin [Candidatus Parabeggiatoa sp. HSG14]|uniref:type II toxin-antitoxin system VapC family toxin n=1 Tax=Candidatus Parabeggiatoa sp. HSG14 TaxID=3055593 RepID=UPI0025A891A5|nr:type II toxin-antitoxin system VapC family toxin [Thiotrichales bacterium HSG14]
MIIYFDASALIKSLIEEPGSINIHNFLLETAQLEETIIFATSAVTKAEIMAALSAIRRGRHLTQKKFEKAVVDFKTRWKAFFIPEVTHFLIDKAGEIGLNHKIKGCDAFQLASALEVETDIFISTDNDLNAAALENGLFVWNPMTEPIPKIKNIIRGRATAKLIPIDKG